MAEYLVQSQSLTAIADAIREKTGKQKPLPLAQMPASIRAIQDLVSRIPTAVRQEAERVAESIRGQQSEDQVTFLVLADAHQFGEREMGDAVMADIYRKSCRNAWLAAAWIADQIDLDFAVDLGDLVYGTSATTLRQGADGILAVHRDSAALEEKTRLFRVPGDHDPLTYSVSQNCSYLAPDLMAGLVGDYGFLDLEEQKLRLIFLNTADNRDREIQSDTGSQGISGEQLQWFANHLDLSEKNQPEQWKILIFSHHPLDWLGVREAANCIAAYLEGGAYEVTHNGAAISYDYAGKNAAKILGNLHGHTHCFLVDWLHEHRSGSPVETGVKRIAMPNVCYNPNNPYGAQPVNGLVYGQDTTYPKTAGDAAKCTAFCLVTVDLKCNRIHADCFGAGYDRVIDA